MIQDEERILRKTGKAGLVRLREERLEDRAVGVSLVFGDGPVVFWVRTIQFPDEPVKDLFFPFLYGRQLVAEPRIGALGVAMVWDEDQLRFVDDDDNGTLIATVSDSDAEAALNAATEAPPEDDDIELQPHCREHEFKVNWMGERVFGLSRKEKLDRFAPELSRILVSTREGYVWRTD